MQSVLSIFPELFEYGFFAPTLLRLGLAVFFFVSISDMGKQKGAIRQMWPKLAEPGVALYKLFFAIIGLLFLLGLYTQIAAILGAIAALKLVVFRKFIKACSPWAPRSDVLYFMVFVVSLSLLVLGPGGFAFDLPL